MSADDTPPRVGDRVTLTGDRRGVVTSIAPDGIATGADWIAELSTLPDRVVELHPPAPAPVEVREDETVPWLKREVDQMGTAILRIEYEHEFQKQIYSRLLRGMARRASRYRRKLHLAAQDAARHHAACAAAPESSDPVLTEAMNRVGEYVSAHQQQGDRGVDLIDERVFDDNRGGWSGELYASDLRAMLNALSVPEASDPAEALCGDYDEKIEPRCPDFHPEYHFTCLLPPHHGFHFDAAGGHWNEHGQVSTWQGDTSPTVPPSPAEVASRLSAAAEVCEKHRHHGLAFEFSQIASQLDEDGYSAEMCAAVARALSGEATPDA